MKYQVMYNNGTRIRVRSGQAAFTKKEGYGISSLLLENNFIKKVFTSHRNGSILIYYDDVKNRDKVFAALDKITEDDLVEVEHDMYMSSNELTNNFWVSLSGMLVRRVLGKIVLPIPIRNLLTVYRATKYMWHALDSLTSFRVDVALLDGAAVTGSLLKRDFDPASSMMFLLSISDLLEDYTLQKTKNTLKESLTLNIDTVWVVNEDGEEIQQPISQINKDDKNIPIVRAKDIASELQNNSLSPYKGIIKFPGQPRGAGFIDLSTIVNSIKPLLESEGIFNKYKITNLENQINVIFNYFNALKIAYENAQLWYNKTVNPFFTNAGFTAAIDVLNRVLIAKCAADKDFTQASFVKHLKLDATLLQRSDIKNKDGKSQRKAIAEFLEESINQDLPTEDGYKF